MGETTGISWTNHTHNMWWGCSKVGNSPACDYCYAENDSNRYGFDIWGDDNPRRYFKAERLRGDLLRWDRLAAKAGEFRLVFVMSMGDWAEGRPEQRVPLDNFWATYLETSHLVMLMLTKRPQLVDKLRPKDLAGATRIWQGITAETQAWLYLRWPILRDTACGGVRWLSIEPMFGRIDLPADFLGLGPRGWVIIGGESGAHARPTFDLEGVRWLIDQCAEAGVPCFVKQTGTLYAKANGLVSITGKDMLELPEWMRVQQFPEIRLSGVPAAVIA